MIDLIQSLTKAIAAVTTAGVIAVTGIFTQTPKPYVTQQYIVVTPEPVNEVNMESNTTQTVPLSPSPSAISLVKTDKKSSQISLTIDGKTYQCDSKKADQINAFVDTINELTNKEQECLQKKSEQKQCDFSLNQNRSEIALTKSKMATILDSCLDSDSKDK